MQFLPAVTNETDVIRAVFSIRELTVDAVALQVSILRPIILSLFIILLLNIIILLGLLIR